VIEDVDAPKDKLRRLYQSQFHKLEFRPFGPIDEGNGVWNQPPGFNTTTGDGAFFERVRGNLGLDAELAGTRPGCQGELRRLDYANTATGEY